MSKPIQILVVDDNDDLRFLMCNWLKRAGYLVHAARHAGEAMSYLQAGTEFDLTVSDLNMPENSGIELYQWLRTHGDRSPFVLVTANAAIERSDVMAAGISDFLPKPFTSESFLTCVKKNLSAVFPYGVKAS